MSKILSIHSKGYGIDAVFGRYDKNEFENSFVVYDLDPSMDCDHDDEDTEPVLFDMYEFACAGKFQTVQLEMFEEKKQTFEFFFTNKNQIKEVFLDHPKLFSPGIQCVFPYRDTLNQRSYQVLVGKIKNGWAMQYLPGWNDSGFPANSRFFVKQL